MTVLDRQIASEFKVRLESAGVPCVRLIAFGARAIEEVRYDSEVDILVVVERSDDAIVQAISDAAWEVGFERGLVLVPVVLTRAEFEDSALGQSMFLRIIKSEGVPI